MLKEKERKTRRGLMLAVDMGVRRQVGFEVSVPLDYDHPSSGNSWLQNGLAHLQASEGGKSQTKSSSGSHLQRGVYQGATRRHWHDGYSYNTNDCS